MASHLTGGSRTEGFSTGEDADRAWSLGPERIERLARGARLLDEDPCSVTLLARDLSGTTASWVLLRLGRGSKGVAALERDRRWLETRPVEVMPQVTDAGVGQDGAFVVGALPGRPVPLDAALLAAEAGGERRRVEKLLGLVADAVAEIRGADLCHGVLTAWKILVIDGTIIRIHDWSRARRRHLRRNGLVVDDLALLVATIPSRLLGSVGRDRLLAAAGLRGRLARRALEVGILRAHAGGIVPRLFPTMKLSGPHLEIRCHSDAADLFVTDRGLSGLLEDARVEELRRLDDRANYRVMIGGAVSGGVSEMTEMTEMTGMSAPEDAGTASASAVTGSDRVFYMKQFMKTPDACEVGLHEWSRTLLVAAAGVPTARPAAVGRGDRGSFFMSHAVAGGIPLDQALVSPGAIAPTERAHLAEEVGRLVARLHRAGLCHRDLYLCHLLLSPAGLRLIDLQRVSEYRRLPRHRRVKDLAALHYASLATSVRPVERLRMLRVYLAETFAADATDGQGRGRRAGAHRSRAGRRRWIRLIERKAARIARHAGPPGVGGLEA